MLRLFSNNRMMFSIYLMLVFCGIFVLVFHGKNDAHLLLTGFHSEFLDHLMKLLTLFGDGLFMVITGILLLFRRIRYGITIMVSFLLTSLMVQVLKRLVFPGCKRPVSWFHDLGIELHKAGGMDYHSAFSFPSGHTATVFALFIGMAFFTKNNGLKILFLLIAMLTGFSRVYLSQHFLGDVLAGSLLGIVTAVSVQLFIGRRTPTWMDKNIASLTWKKNERDHKA